MPKYNDHIVQKVGKAIYEADGAFYGVPYERLPEIGEFDPETGDVKSQGFYRYLATAALAAIDSLYESEAEQPVEYAGIEGGAVVMAKSAPMFPDRTLDRERHPETTTLVCRFIINTGGYASIETIAKEVEQSLDWLVYDHDAILEGMWNEEYGDE